MAGYWLLILLLPAFFTHKNLRKNTLLLAVAVCLLAGPALYARLQSLEELVRLTVIDVGQGQSILVTWQGKERGRALIDGGGFATGDFDIGRQVVTPVLTENAPARLDWIINSHSDAGHLQGLLFPLASFSVAHVAFGSHEPEKRTKTMGKRDAIIRSRHMTPQTVRAADTIFLSQHLSLKVLHPDETRGKSSNDNALVLRLMRDGKPLEIICGDVERKGLKELLESGEDCTAAVLIVPHHGSAGSFSPEFYDAVNPKLAVASCGYANTWHFPADRIRDALRERNIPLLTTADQGQIRITWKNGSMEVETARR
jgi:competence protein ComEC